jgi:hypothetical protein
MLTEESLEIAKKTKKNSSGTLLFFFIEFFVFYADIYIDILIFPVNFVL